MGGTRIDGAAPPVVNVDTSSRNTVTVKRGDTLQSIADRNRVELRDLMAANGITNPKQAFIQAQELKLPTKNYAAPPPVVTDLAAHKDVPPAPAAGTVD